MIPQFLPVELKQKMDAGESIYLLDVRTPEEHEHCRLANSTLIPLSDLAQRVKEVKPPEGAQIVAYCHHGVRSLAAAAFLIQAGFKNAASLAGGIDLWSRTVDESVPRY